MQKLNILNTREVKKIKEIILEDYGYFPEEEYAYLQSEKGKNDKEKIYLVNKDLARIDLKKLRIDKLGLYFAELKDNHIRLSKEGVQLLGKLAEDNKKELKNVVELNKKEVKSYFNGDDLEKDLGDKNRFILLRYQKEFLGCAKYKDQKILNFLPKIYRGEVILE
ncbi:MAG: hypothetical protein ABIG52_01475 [Nanoarchaeota archaeon]